MNDDVFEYGGYHFTPHRKFRGKSEQDFFTVSQKLRTDFELGLFSDQTRKGFRADYGYDEFYAASTDKDCDIFRCVETGGCMSPAQMNCSGSMNPEREIGVTQDE
jgi:hypothetical protein